MAANTPADTELLLDDDDDALVPITGTMPLPAADAALPAAPGDGFSDELAALVEPAIHWASSPYPAFGVRALLFAVSGVSFGISRRERDLRFALCELYRVAHDQPNLKGN